MEKDWSFTFKILIKKQGDLWVAHCLELDLVTAASTKEEVEKDIFSVISEQVRYCIVNDNMENLFRSAPKEVWDEFRACEERVDQEFVCEYPSGQARGWYFSLEITGAKPRIILNVFCSGSGWSA